MFPQKCKNCVKNMKYRFLGDKLQIFNDKKT